MTTFDLNILPIHRLNGQDLPDLPGLLAVAPPRRTARGREKDSLVLYLMLTGNATFTAQEVDALNRKAATTFYQAAGTLTSAMRKAAENINTALLERNLATTGRGQYALGMLVIASIRDEKCTILLSGPSHAVWLGNGPTRHIHDPALSGKGLGAGQNVQTYFSQVELHTNDLLLVCGKFPKDWEADLLGEHPPTSLEARYRKLTLTKGDLNAAIIQPQTGPGIITVLHAETGAPPLTQEPPASLPQTLPPADDEPVEDVLIAAPPAFQQEPEHAQPVSTHYPVPEELEQFSSSQPADDESTDEQLPSITEEELDELADFAAHLIQPANYEQPPQESQELPPLPSVLSATTASPSTPRNFPPSIPRLKAIETPVSQPQPEPEEEDDELDAEEDLLEEEPETVSEPRPSLLSGLRSTFNKPKETAPKPTAHGEATRQMAKVMVGGIQTGRKMNEGLRSFFQRFIPRLLPGHEEPEAQEGAAVQQQMFFMPTYMLVTIALIIPILVGTMAVVVYLRYGQSVQYDEYYNQALNARAQAASQTDPIRQRDAWQAVLNFVNKAESYRQTDESNLLRSEAQGNLDTLLGVVRLEFVPAFTNGLSGTAKISRLAASESDLYMLDAERGEILHASFTGRSLEPDATFDCKPGTYAGYQVDTLVDLLALPKVNLAGATVLGIDASGKLLYCAPGQVPQAIPLPALPNTNWGRVTSFTLDSGNLYVLDATARAVWVFPGKDSTFTDTPYFYFGTQIPQTLDTAIDLAVSGDDLYLLHADGHLSTCTFSRIAETPTKCVDPINYQDPFPAHQDLNLFGQANFTQLTLTAPPNSVVLLLDSTNQKVFRFTPRSVELQNQIAAHAGDGNPFQAGPVGAMTVSPNYVLYLAIDNQVYFATNLP